MVNNKHGYEHRVLNEDDFSRAREAGEQAGRAIVDLLKSTSLDDRGEGGIRDSRYEFISEAITCSNAVSEARAFAEEYQSLVETFQDAVAPTLQRYVSELEESLKSTRDWRVLAELRLRLTLVDATADLASTDEDNKAADVDLRAVHERAAGLASRCMRQEIFLLCDLIAANPADDEMVNALKVRMHEEFESDGGASLFPIDARHLGVMDALDLKPMTAEQVEAEMRRHVSDDYV